jgi:hypothetical protein
VLTSLAVLIVFISKDNSREGIQDWIDLMYGWKRHCCEAWRAVIHTIAIFLRP